MNIRNAVQFHTDSNYSTPPKSPVVSGSFGTAQESTDSRPRPPSPPPHTSPITVGGAKPAAGSYSSPSTTHHSPQPPREDSVKCETTIVCVCVCTVCSVCSIYVVCVVCVCTVRVFVESMYKENEKRYPLFTLVFNYVKE